jgi:hypothetical protein
MKLPRLSLDADMVRKLVALPARLRDAILTIERNEHALVALANRLDALSSRVEVGEAAPAGLAADKMRPEYSAAYDLPEPLVTVCIATYNRSELLVTRAVRSILAQDYRNLQIVVVGDACTDDTEQRMAQVRDGRVTFFNLPERGKYPEDPHARWMVAGSAAMNEGLRRAEGQFVTHLDDDDEHLPERITTLLGDIRRARADLVYHPFWREQPDGSWRLVEAEGFQRRAVSTGSILYHRWFSRVHWDLDAYRMGEPGDWNRLRKLSYLGASTVRCSTALLRHFCERKQGVAGAPASQNTGGSRS